MDLDNLKKLIDENKGKKRTFEKKTRIVNGQPVEYSVPTLITGYGAFYYLCDRDPTSSEPDCYTDISDFLYCWQNQTSGELWWCQDNSEDAMVFARTITPLNLVSELSAVGFNAPVASGDATLSLGAATVSLSSLTTGQKIKLSYKTPAGVPGAVFPSSFTAGTGFHIGSTSLLDSSVIHWEISN